MLAVAGDCSSTLLLDYEQRRWRAGDDRRP